VRSGEEDRRRGAEGTWLCTDVLELPDGYIILEGEDPAGEGAYVLAVTGATGLYAGAGGEANATDVGDRAELSNALES
jgi:hypothetical protein